MAIAKFHSLRGEKSALLLVKVNPLELTSSPAYVSREGVTYFAKKEASELEKDDTFEIPDGFTLVPMVDTETGDARTAENGNVLMMLSYS